MNDSSIQPVLQASLDKHEEGFRLREALLGSEPDAWRAFFQSHGRVVRAAILRVVRRFGISGDSEDVRDIEATFAVELLANDRAKLRAFQPERGILFSTWVGLLASHAAYDFLRRRRREPAGNQVDTEMLSSDAPDPFAMCELRERARLVDAMVSDFTCKDREFLELYYALGLEPNQVAAAMGISVKTVYSKKHKIQGRLESLLARAQAA